MSSANIYGQIISGGVVERAVCDFLGAQEIALIAAGSPSGNGYWIDTYLNEIERIEGYTPGSIQRPRGIVTASEFDKWPEDALPVLLVISPGLTQPPERRGDSSYEARWAVGVAAVVSDINVLQTRRLAMAYGAAVRAAMLQHAKLGGFASYLDWLDETYGDIPFADSRSIEAVRIVFEVGVENVVRRAAGPDVPAPIPVGNAPQSDPGPWPSVVPPVTTTVLPKRITETVT